ncbi:MAG: hypothetical protein ACLUYV_05175 [Alistipes shahii]
MAPAQVVESIPLRGAVVPVRLAPRARWTVTLWRSRLVLLNVAAALDRTSGALRRAASPCRRFLPAAGAPDWVRERRGNRGGMLSVPYYFSHEFLNVFRGAWYLATPPGAAGRGKKARRA